MQTNCCPGARTRLKSSFLAQTELVLGSCRASWSLFWLNTGTHPWLFVQWLLASLNGKRFQPKFFFWRRRRRNLPFHTGVSVVCEDVSDSVRLDCFTLSMRLVVYCVTRSDVWDGHENIYGTWERSLLLYWMSRLKRTFSQMCLYLLFCL